MKSSMWNLNQWPLSHYPNTAQLHHGLAQQPHNTQAQSQNLTKPPQSSRKDTRNRAFEPYNRKWNNDYFQMVFGNIIRYQIFEL